MFVERALVIKYLCNIRPITQSLDNSSINKTMAINKKALGTPSNRRMTFVLVFGTFSSHVSDYWIHASMSEHSELG